MKNNPASIISLKYDDTKISVELHIIELKKSLPGDRLDDWIQLFHAESKEELEMLATKNKGLAKAVEIMKRKSRVRSAPCFILLSDA